MLQRWYASIVVSHNGIRELTSLSQGVQKKTRKFATVKRIIGQRDARLKKNQLKGEVEAEKKAKSGEVVREMWVPQGVL